MNAKILKVGISGGLLAGILAPNAAHACACGCGIFDVATSSMFPQGPGGMAFLDYDYQNQYKNWSGLNRAPAANNGDKSIGTYWVTPGIQYFFNSSWGLEAEIPYENREFKTVTSNPNVPPGTLASMHWSDLGDIRVRGIYTGFSEDMSTGLTFGLKLPTGDYTYNDAFGDVDRDSEIGTGSTDLLVGMFHRGHLAKDGSFDWFGQIETDLPMLTRDEYRPGFEADEALGIYYTGFSVGKLNIVPIAQLLASERTSDSGNNASGGINDPPVGLKDSGYQRLLVSPGVEFDMHRWSFYADVEVPVVQHVVGNQLVAPALFKAIFTYHF